VLLSNTTGSQNTASGFQANVSFPGNLNNATAIGARALVNASNKVRLGNTDVTVIEGQVAFTASSDKTKKENFEPVDGEAVLGKIRGFKLSSWNFIGHDPKEFRHYGPMAQDFFASFGHDGVGQIGTETTINSGDLAGILMVAVQALEKRTAELKQKEAQIAVLESQVEELKAKQASFESVAARLEALELRQHQSMQITAGAK
jgi:Chaperone of endosialidase